ncbi:phage portal protein [Glycomyces sp. NPDC046736]|uniref:phage portal protein n=1 Tax=Glycomyces sp. NPDC046736 TaxID=3155615 RepID=UPI0033CFF337
MPIPGTEEPEAPWPPAWMGPILDRIEVWAAWHSGDPDKLAAVYSGQAEPDRTGFFASEGGGFRRTVRRLISRVVRYFWATRTNGQPRRRLHDPIAGDIASASADLLFSEPPTITISRLGETEPPPAEDDKDTDGAAARPEPSPETAAAQQFVDDLMDDGAHARLLEGAETCAALSGVFLRARWDTEKAAAPWFDVIAPDCAVPEWELGHLVACTFWKVIKRSGRTVYRHLERHAVGSVEHAVFAGTEDTLGLPASQGLAGFTGTTALADVVDEVGTIATGIDRLTVEYVPNMRPNRIWRDIPQAAHLGVSDFSGIEGLMDALDLSYSSMVRDVDLGKARIVVPKAYMGDHGRGKGASFDLDREVYEPINAMIDEDKGLQIELVQAEIRVEEHEAVILRIKTDTVSSAGYSPQTFGLTGEVAITATEVAAKERRSWTTRARKCRYWGPALRSMITTLLELAGHTGFEVTLEWPDAVAVDPEAVSRKVANWETARAASTETKVRELHPDWDDTAVDAEVEKILEEQQIGAQLDDPDMFDVDGHPANTSPDGENEDASADERELAGAGA